MSDDVAVTRRHGRQPSSTADRPHGGSRFRADVEGLRAIAVGLVLLYHAGVSDLSGGFVGVDVFFVISGFLITSLLLAEFDRRGTVSLVTFYARRAKRLLPAACIVLLVTAVLSRALLPEYRWESTGGDIVAAAFYFVNWRLADRSVDYLAEDVDASPVQHFWSLAVEEQFYIVWPLLMVAVALLARRYGHGRRLLTLGLIGIAVLSFAYSLSETDANPARAFFVTPTRMWELAVGGLVAVAVALLPRIPRVVALALGWGGLAAIVAAGFVVSETMPWPGWRAALPVLGTAAVIAAGPAAGRAGPALLLGTKPMCWIGGLSYSLYLWHWPLLVIAEDRYDGLTATQGLLVVAVSVVPAWITHKLVENPIRHSRRLAAKPRLALGVGANVTVAAAVSGLVLVALVGAGGGPIRPNPVRAEQDVPDLYAKGCQQDQLSAEVVTCTYGPPSAKTTVAVFGDSKIAQWVPALQEMVPANDLRVVTYTKSACAPADVDTMGNNGVYTSCREWVRNVLAELTGPQRPDVVLTSQRISEAAPSTDSPEQRRATMIGGLDATWAQLQTAGIRVIVLADTPSPPFTVWKCVAENRSSLEKCEFERDPAVANSAAPLLRDAVAGAAGPAYIDLLANICPVPLCPPVIDDVLVYRQGSHLTATYVKVLAPALAEALRSAGVPLNSP